MCKVFEIPWRQFDDQGVKSILHRLGRILLGKEKADLLKRNGQWL